MFFDLMPQQPSQSSSLDQHSAGRLIGAYRWTERQLFTLLGGWASTVSETGVKMFLDQQSFEYAWHAELWTDRLPDHRGLTPAGLTAPANPGVALMFRQLTDESSSSSTVAKLTAVYRVILPRLITTYSAHLNQANGSGNDPTQRALRLILADELTAWRVGETHLQSLLVDKEAVGEAIDQQQNLELALLDSGGLANLAG